MCSVDPKSIQNGALGIPGWRPASAWDLHWAFPPALLAGFQTLLQIHEENDEFWHDPVTSWKPPGDSEVIQKSKTNRFCGFQRRSKHDFCTILVEITVCTFCVWFGIVFSWKNVEKMMEKHMHVFYSIACFFEQGDPHETSYFTIRKLLFHFLCFCFFLRECRKVA